MNYATGGPSGRWSSQADPRARPLWAPTYLLPPGPARSAAMAPWLGTPRGRGHGRAGLTDHTARNGPVQTRTINRQGEGGVRGERRSPSWDMEGAGGRPEVTGAGTLRGKRLGHAPQSALARGSSRANSTQTSLQTPTQQVLCACAGLFPRRFPTAACPGAQCQARASPPQTLC